MSINKQPRKHTEAAADTDKWDQAIADARARIAELRHAIKVFEERKLAGDPWPDDTSE